MSKLTKRQQFWLDHLKCCEASGERLTDYAKANDLSLSALYQSKTALSKRGLLNDRRRIAPVFDQVSVLDTTSVSILRLRLRNGIVVEVSDVGHDQLRQVLALAESL